MKRIFLTLAAIGTLLFLLTIALGLSIGDSRSLDPVVQRRISNHMLLGVATLTFNVLVHAIALTYFMGTGRWIEETSRAYSLPPDFHQQSQKIKYRMLPGMTVCLLLLIATGALGAIADPATPMSLDGFMGLTGAQIHFLTAVTTAFFNLVVNVTQYAAISRNSAIVDAVVAEVLRIRREKGLQT